MPLAVLPVALVDTLSVWEHKTLVAVTGRRKVWYAVRPTALQGLTSNVKGSFSVHHIIFPVSLINFSTRKSTTPVTMPFSSKEVTGISTCVRPRDGSFSMMFPVTPRAFVHSPILIFVECTPLI
ncbi:unnamed protein product, partial [Heterosigma akashiwo]